MMKQAVVSPATSLLEEAKPNSSYMLPDAYTEIIILLIDSSIRDRRKCFVIAYAKCYVCLNVNVNLMNTYNL